MKKMKTGENITKEGNSLRACMTLLLTLVTTYGVGQLQWGHYDLELNSEVTTVYTDTNNDLLYIAGKFGLISGDTTPGIAVYDGATWSAVGGFDTVVGWVYAIAVYHDTLFIGGYQGSLGGLKKWDGSDWVAVGGTEVYGQVYDLEVVDDELWVAGNFDSIGNVPAHGLARWNGIEWKTAYDFPADLNGPNNPNRIVEVTEYKGDIYIGGNLNTDEYLSEMAVWDGQEWKDVGEAGIKQDGFSGVNRMVEYKGDLYVMGRFMASQGNADNNIMRWNGDAWLPCGGGIDFGVYDAVVYQDKLWITGGINYAGGVPADGLAVWDGEQWCSPGNEFNAWPAGIGVYRDTLILGGSFQTIDNDSFSYLAHWTGAGDYDSCGVLWPIGIESATAVNKHIRLYPNPVKEKLHIALLQHIKRVDITIFSPSGHTVYKAGFVGGPSPLVVPMESRPPGIYLLQLQFDNKIQIHRIVKQ